ncbi:hypothetical protein IV203_025366 [Nitzschia inconspicua]|uniref:Uncharacterized protein n=1 Tax=Nitzschia inconspicua TaxID=303405 RepID=A0A9K3K9K7_9STRA|nr:hypothetical protein IV203_024827 [Nitzschia inconspicua]KAG7362482.1 hypothetical protein IV203_025366 [Nitzschia inconspicua]
MPDLRGTSNFCARYSIIGLIFMTMVAMLLTYQPFFIGGIENLERATRNAYGAIGTFLFTLILSVVYLVLDVLKSGGGGRGRGGRDSGNFGRSMPPMDYDMVPTNNSSSWMVGGGDRILQQHNANLDLPLSVEQAHFT